MSSFDLNKVILIGNVGKQPDIRDYGPNKDKKMSKFTLATNESWKNKQTGEYETDTTWHNIVCFNDFLTGVIMKHVGVGTKLYVEGQIKTRRYRKEGDTEDRYITEIILPMFGGDIKVLTRGEQADPDALPQDVGGSDDPFKDDIPF